MEANVREYKLLNGRTLYFSPVNNHFYLDNFSALSNPEYCDKSLISLRLEITGRCNGKCTYCIVYGNHVEKIDIIDLPSSWDWLTSLPWFKKIKDIFIIGGEPLLHFEDILFILEHFQGSVSFSTNGTLITKSIAEKLAQYNVMVYVSLDGISEHDNINRIYKDGSLMYKDIFRGLNLLEEAGVRKGLFMVATPNTINSISTILIELTSQYHISRVGYSMPHWTPTAYDLVTAEQYRDALLNLFCNRKKINAEIMQVGWRLYPLAEGKVKEFSCSLHTQQITVLPDKSIVRCSKIDSLPDKAKYSNAWLDRNCPIALFKKNIEPCSSCLALSCCGGGCPFDGIKRYQTAIDRRECIVTKPLVTHAIKEIVSAIDDSCETLLEGEIHPSVIKEILFS